MASAITLDGIVLDMIPLVRRLDLSNMDPRTQIAWLATAYSGIDGVASQPELLNIAGLALSMQDRLVMHRLSKGSVNLVHDTDLHAFPSQTPEFMRQPFLVSSRKPSKGEALFGDTTQIGGYWLDDTLYLVILSGGHGDSTRVSVVPWKPIWASAAIDEFVPDDTPFVDKDIWDTWQDEARKAVRFITVLSILFGAENTPVLIDEPKGASLSQDKVSKGRSSLHPSQNKWSTRRVFIDARLYRPVPDDIREPDESGRINLEETTIMVSSHLKRQPYGPKSSLRKWVYVQSYEARRWVTTRPVRVDVRLFAEKT